jgi:hypothetical protein
MSKLVRALLLTTVVAVACTEAHAAGTWCAFYDSSTYNCGFHTDQQCYLFSAMAGGADQTSSNRSLKRAGRIAARATSTGAPGIISDLARISSSGSDQARLSLSGRQR